jgi:pimeloyl-ACP methyl ester carboxylesterase
MATYVFVHGAWHGGWCWHRIAAHLQRAMHRVVTPDLISLGRDRTPAGNVTLAQWTEQITRLVTAEPEPVILVGHSRGGIVLSEVAERICERVRTLVYVTAFLLESGHSLQQANALTRTCSWLDHCSCPSRSRRLRLRFGPRLRVMVAYRAST